MTTDDRAEDAYFRVYELAADISDYTQPDDQRWYSPEGIAEAIAALLILTPLTAMFQEVGKDGYSRLKARALQRRSVEQVRSEDVVEALREALPMLTKQPEQEDRAKREIVSLLLQHGVPEGESIRIAEATIGILLEATGDDAEV